MIEISSVTPRTPPRPLNHVLRSPASFLHPRLEVALILTRAIGLPGNLESFYLWPDLATSRAFFRGLKNAFAGLVLQPIPWQRFRRQSSPSIRRTRSKMP